MFLALPAILTLVAMSAEASSHKTGEKLVGGWDEADQSDPRFQEILTWTTTAVSAREGGPPETAKLVKVISAHRQVVAGMNYRLRFEMSDEADASLPNSICDVVVYERPWQNHREITSFTCEEKKE